MTAPGRVRTLLCTTLYIEDWTHVSSTNALVVRWSQDPQFKGKLFI
jgi:hypothetical protein